MPYFAFVYTKAVLVKKQMDFQGIQKSLPPQEKAVLLRRRIKKKGL